jgi:shikimate kinase
MSSHMAVNVRDVPIATRTLPAVNVVLTGFMGTGKTTVGRLLAARLGFGFVDTDAVIAERHGPIPVIFAERGEGEFRRIEREVAAELAAQDGLVVSTGGRLLLDPVNAEALQRTGRVFCLSATVDTIVARVAPGGRAAGRPLLAGADARERITDLLEQRAAGYGRFEQVVTDDRTPADIVDAIVTLLAVP